jgi:hypothetical protein
VRTDKSKPGSAFNSSGDSAKVKSIAHNADLNDAMREGVGVDAQFNIKSLPDHVKQQFDAHGAASVDAMSSILSGGVDKSRSFFTATLADGDSGGSGLGLRTNSPFLLLGHPGKPISTGGVGAVIVDGNHSGAIPILQKHFPNVRFIPASEAEMRMRKFQPGPAVQHGKSTDSKTSFHPADIGDKAAELAIHAREKFRKATGLGESHHCGNDMQRAVAIALESVASTDEARAVLSQLMEETNG